MAGWNNRVIRQTFDTGEVMFALHEVYYDDNGTPKSITSDPVFPHGETLEELQADIARMLEATKKPVLNYEDF